MLVAFLSAFFTAFFSLVLTPLYQASARFYIPTDAAASTGVSSPTGLSVPALIGTPVLREQAKTHVAVLESRDAHVAVADRLKDRTLDQVYKAADFDVTPSSSLVIYVRDKDPAVAMRMVELFVEYFKSFHALRLDNAIRMVEKPYVTQDPVFPLVILNTIIGTAGGFLFGIIYALFLDYLEVRSLGKKLRQLEEEEWFNDALREAPGVRELP